VRMIRNYTSITYSRKAYLFNRGLKFPCVRARHEMASTWHVNDTTADDRISPRDQSHSVVHEDGFPAVPPAGSHTFVTHKFRLGVPRSTNISAQHPVIDHVNSPTVSSSKPSFSISNNSSADLLPDQTLSDASIPNSPLEHRRASSHGEQRFENALKILREGRLGPADLLLHALCHPNNRYRTGLLKAGGKFGSILDEVMKFPEGKARLTEWVQDKGVAIIETIVGREMDTVQKSFSCKTADITPESVSDSVLKTKLYR
jgi:hypothetical protein